jgi:hypothetical protein
MGGGGPGDTTRIVDVVAEIRTEPFRTEVQSVTARPLWFELLRVGVGLASWNQ